MLITKIDETRFRGSLLNISWYTQKPLAYVTTGQNVPDDIEVVDVESLAKQIIRGQTSGERGYVAEDKVSSTGDSGRPADESVQRTEETWLPDERPVQLAEEPEQPADESAQSAQSAG
jgi:hypothetical protein